MDATSLSRAATLGADMQAFFDAVSANDVERAGTILADNVLLLLPGLQPVHGRRRALRLMRLIRHRFADIRWSPAGTLDAEPGWMISTWTMTGTLATGGSFRHEVASVARLDVEGKVAYLSDYLKSTDRAGSRAPRGLSPGAAPIAR